MPKYLKKKEKKRFPAGAIVLVLVLALVVTGGFLAWKYVINNIQPVVTIEVGGTATAEDFLIRDTKMEAQLETDLSSLDLSVPGDHSVSVRYFWLSHKSVLQVRDTVAPAGLVQDLTAFANQVPEAGDFVTAVTDQTAVTVSYAENPDVTLAGDQSVTIVLTDMGGNSTEYDATLTLIFDVTAPEIVGAADRTLYVGQEADLLKGVSVTDDLDEAPVLTVDDSQLDVSTEGTYEVTYTAADASANETSVTVTMTVMKDTQAPELLGVRPLSAYAGSTIAYRSNVIVTDDTDTAPKLTIDSSKVDLSTPGVYTVVYTATDGAGNITTKEVTVTVEEAPDNFVEYEKIYEAADKVLARIVNDGMSTKGKVQAIYKWVLNECWYSNNTVKADWMQVAWQMLDTGTGDCFGFYSVTRLLFERLGIPNLTVQRSPEAARTTTHFWSMVSVDGGETYYHFDSCPHPKPAHNMCLVTDATLEWFNSHCTDYYLYDKSLYPATPGE